MPHIKELNAHERPPEAIRQRYKSLQKASLSEIDTDETILDPKALNPNDLPDNISLSHWVSSHDFRPVFQQFAGEHEDSLPESIPVYTHKSVSG
jgi:hypothetical protein